MRKPVEPQQTKQQAKVTDAVGDKRLLAGIGSPRAIMPETDQEVRTHPDQLPEDINLHQVGANDEA